MKNLIKWDFTKKPEFENSSIVSLKKILRGTGVAIITPFTSNKEVDYDALEKLINYDIDNGVDYIVSLGTTGETPTLSKDEKKSIVDFTISKINGRVPVVIGVGGNNTQNIIESMHDVPADKVTAILSNSPYYNKPSQEGIFQHYKLIAQHAPVPVILYNVPGRTGSNISTETTLKLADECENIQGIKEASGNMVQCMHIIKDCPDDFLVVSGDDHLALPLIACGMDGVISVAANCFPKDFSALVNAALENDFGKACQFHYKLLDGMDLLFAENNPAGVKAFLAEMGIIHNELRLPLVQLSNPMHEKVKVFLKTI